MEELYNVTQLKEKLLYAVGKCADYSRYWSTLINMEDEYDETLEVYNLDVWYGKSGGAIRTKAAEMLRVTATLFWDLRENSIEELYYTMKMITERSEQEQQEIWGVFLEKETFTKEWFDGVMESWEDYEYNQQDALDGFLKCVSEMLQMI